MVNHYGIIQNILTAQKIFCALPSHPSAANSGNYWSFFTVPVVLPLADIIELKSYVGSLFWLSSFD